MIYSITFMPSIMLKLLAAILGASLVTAQAPGCKAPISPLTTLLYPEGFEYNRLVRPNHGGPPDKVFLQLFIRSVDKIPTPELEEIRLQATIRHYWNDPRLQFEDFDQNYRVNLPGNEGSKLIWTPDTFITNSKDEYKHSLFHDNELTRIYPNGDIVWSARVTMTLACPSVALIGTDDVTCQIKLGSYALTTDEVTYSWFEDKPVTTNTNLGPFSWNQRIVQTATANYSALDTSFAVPRSLAFEST